MISPRSLAAVPARRTAGARGGELQQRNQAPRRPAPGKGHPAGTAPTGVRLRPSRVRPGWRQPGTETAGTAPLRAGLHAERAAVPTGGEPRPGAKRGFPPQPSGVTMRGAREPACGQPWPSGGPGRRRVSLRGAARRRLPDCGGGAVRPPDGDDQRARGDREGRGGAGGAGGSPGVVVVEAGEFTGGAQRLVDGLPERPGLPEPAGLGVPDGGHGEPGPRKPAPSGSARRPGGGRPSPPTAARRSHQGQTGRTRRPGGGHSGSARPAKSRPRRAAPAPYGRSARYNR
jgi:hypothetical protein